VTISFTVHGLPVAQGSKRHVGNGVMVESSKNLKPWRAAIAAEAAAQAGGERIHGPVKVEAAFFFPRPKAHYVTGKNSKAVKHLAPIYCSKRPDIDKLARALLDGLAGVALADDAQVCVLLARKFWGEPARAEVAIEEL